VSGASVAQMAEALLVLKALGIPVDRLTVRRREHMSRAFLTLLGLKPGSGWTDARDMTSLTMTTKQILRFCREHHGETRSDGTYDDVRRSDLELVVTAGIVQAAANKQSANTNDSTRGYGVHPQAAKVARAFGTAQWQKSCAEFTAAWPSLAEDLERKRSIAKQRVTLPSGVTLAFTADGHNTLQRAVIEQFLPRFGHGAQVLYVGEAADKRKHVDGDGLRRLGVFELAHDKLPDVVAYSEAKNWLFLIEAVTTANPVSEVRRLTLENLLRAPCVADRIYVTAFPNRPTFRRFAADVAWETEVWIADAPDHLVHFNGDKFLGPHRAEPAP
jgi:BsuBI/PstI restriction endonuclease domain/BsuBI/PstI restriction endonuclease HTH domain